MWKGLVTTCPFWTCVRDVVPVHSKAKAQSSHQDHRLSDRHHQGSMPGMKHHRHDPPESSLTSSAEFPAKKHTNHLPAISTLTWQLIFPILSRTHEIMIIIIDYHIDVPHNDCGVFWPGCQFCAIIGELAEPDFIAVFGENLLRVARELFPKD